jgi:PqqD family protein of HPr-rel-A system
MRALWSDRAGNEMHIESQHIRWCVPSSERLKWRHWDDGSLAYHIESGQTHYLNNFAVYVLQFLLERPATASEIAEDIQLPAGDAAVPHVEKIPALLEQFAELGLIAPSP